MEGGWDQGWVLQTEPCVPCAGGVRMGGGTMVLFGAAITPFSSVPSGGLKCPVCSFVYGTKWEFNRHLKNKHGLKLVENEGDSKWEVTFSSLVLILTFPDTNDRPGRPRSFTQTVAPQRIGFSGQETRKSFQSLSPVGGVRPGLWLRILALS